MLKQVVDFLTGAISLDQARIEMIKMTRRYAKRQMTWLRSQPDIFRVSYDRKNELKEKVSKFWE